MFVILVLALGLIAAIVAAQPVISATPDGPALYNRYCADCHGPLATTSRGGMTAEQISAAIRSVGLMSGLSILTSDQIAAIASALR